MTEGKASQAFDQTGQAMFSAFFLQQIFCLVKSGEAMLELTELRMAQLSL